MRDIAKKQKSDISIHTPRVGSDQLCFHAHHALSAISIHAPRVGSDDLMAFAHRASSISIHAPRVGSDYHCRERAGYCLNFNPRSPCGERRWRG